MSFLSEGRNSFRRIVRLQIKIQPAAPAETGCVKRVLRAHMKINQIHGNLQMPLGLHESAHDPERSHRVTVLHEKTGDDRLIRALMWAGLIDVSFLQRESSTAGLQNKSVFGNDDCRTEWVVAGLDHGDHISLRIRGAEVAGVAFWRIPGVIVLCPVGQDQVTARLCIVPVQQHPAADLIHVIGVADIFEAVRKSKLDGLHLQMGRFRFPEVFR